MDPILEVTRPTSFGSWSPTEGVEIPAYRVVNESLPTPAITQLQKDQRPQQVQQLAAKWNELNKHKDQFKVLGRDFSRYRSMANPVEAVDKGPFFNRAGVKLANMDSIFRLTNKFRDPQLQGREGIGLNFAALADGPGSFVEYLQFRDPNAKGVGITLLEAADPSLAWNKDKLDMSRFTTLERYQNYRVTGDLTTEAQLHIQWALGIQQGYDLITADGGVEVGDQENLQEFKNSRLLISQAMVGLFLVRKSSDSSSKQGRGGHMVLKMFGGVNLQTLQLVYLLCHCFLKVYIFKPATSRPANAEFYCVCKYARDQEKCGPIQNILANAYNYYLQGYLVDTLVSGVPEKFLSWYLQEVNMLLDLQRQVCLSILKLGGLKDYYQRQDIIIAKPLDPVSCLILWNLPTSKDKELERRAYRPNNITPRVTSTAMPSVAQVPSAPASKPQSNVALPSSTKSMRMPASTLEIPSFSSSGPSSRASKPMVGRDGVLNITAGKASIGIEPYRRKKRYQI